MAEKWFVDTPEVVSVQFAVSDEYPFPIPGMCVSSTTVLFTVIVGAEGFSTLNETYCLHILLLTALLIVKVCDIADGHFS